MKQKKPIVSILTLIIITITSMSCGLMDIMDEISTEATQAGLEPSVASSQEMEDEKGPATEEPEFGTITGQVAYPSEFIPPQRVVAFNTDDLSEYYVVEVPSGGLYNLDVPPGAYWVLSFLVDPASLGATPGLNAAYSQAVLCGLQYGCDDHSLVSVTVKAGDTAADINPVDWYLLPGEDADWPDDPMQTATGAVTGSLGYPSEYIPPLRVVAFDVYSSDYYYVDTELNQGTYQLEGLPAGVYHVVAYVREQGADISAGYSYFVPCGMSVDCSDHNLIDVAVYSGQVTEDVDPIDFYATPGETDWPANPTE